MAITPDSPWRDIGAAPLDAWVRALAGTPLESHAFTLHREAGPLSLLCLAQLAVETRYGDSAIARATNNPLLLRPGPGATGPVYTHPVHGDFLVFPSPVEAVVEWRRRITDPAYKDGVYARTETLRDYLAVYAPVGDGENNPSNYAETAAWLISGYLAESDPMAIVFGRVPHPAFTDQLIPDANTAAWNNLGQRTVKGVVYHRMLGSLSGTDTYFNAVPPGGAAACPPPGSQWVWGGCNGLTDWGVHQTSGALWRWNDPTGAAHPGVSANRSPWASGPYVASLAYGDGKAFVEDAGVNAVNRDQASIEIAGNYEDAISAACKQAVAALTAYYADQARIPWDAYPIIPGKGYSFVRWHNEFCGVATKPCPGSVVMAQTDDLIERTRAILKQYQEQAATTTAPPGGTVDYPEGMDAGVAGMIFGTFTDAKGAVWTYQETGTLSRMWLDDGRVGKDWGRLLDVRHFDVRTYWLFSNGVTYWRPNASSSPRRLG